MKLTQKELIRLQKETHLLEHGFYDKEIQRQFYFKAYANCHEKNGELLLGGPLTEYGRRFSKSYFEGLRKDEQTEVRCNWFKEKFPEFFEKDIK